MGLSAISNSFRRRLHSTNHTDESYEKIQNPLDINSQKPCSKSQNRSFSNLFAFKSNNCNTNLNKNQQDVKFTTTRSSLDSHPVTQEKSKPRSASLLNNTNEHSSLPRLPLRRDRKRVKSGLFRKSIDKDSIPPVQIVKEEVVNKDQKEKIISSKLKNSQDTQSRKPNFLNSLKRYNSSKIRRSKLKDLSTTELIDSIIEQNPQDAAQYTENVVQLLSNDDILLGDVIHVIFTQEAHLDSSNLSNSSVSSSSLSNDNDLPSPASSNYKATKSESTEPREQFQRTWVVTTLIRHGSSSLMERIASHRPHIRALASIFDASSTSLNPIVAGYAADILRCLFHSYSKEVSNALRGTKILQRLVEHLPTQAAEDLLPRFVATKMFTTFSPQPLIPSHKRAIAMMGSAHIQDLLANKFVDASKRLIANERGEKGRHAKATIDSVSRTMSEISVRAMSLRRKKEDADERNDTAYAGNLGLVTAHIFNDAKDHMDLLRNTKPLEKILEIAFGEGKDQKDILLAAISLTTRILTGLREMRCTSLPALRKVVEGFVPNDIALVLTNIVQGFVYVLEKDAPVVGRIRLAITDLLKEACALFEEKILEDFLDVHDHEIIKQLLILADKFPNNEIFQGRIGQILDTIFDNSEKLTSWLLTKTSVLQLILRMKERHSFHRALSHLIDYKHSEDIINQLSTENVELLNQLEEYYEETVRHEGQGLMKQPKMSHMKSNPDISFDFTNLDTDTVHEDYGQKLYLRRLIQESTADFENDSSSDELHIDHSVGAITQGFHEGFMHLFKHDDDDDE